MADVRKKLMRLEDIKIQQDFLETTPNPEKVKAYKKFYKENGRTEKLITVNGNGVLKDGYIQYLILKEAGIEEVEVIKVKTTRKEKKGHKPNGDYRKEPTVYVFGKHGKGKEYVWRIPKRWVDKGLHEQIKVGDWIIVNTRFGKNTITVTRVETLAKPPVEGRIKKVVGKRKKYKKIYCNRVGTPDTDKDNEFLLKVADCGEMLKRTMPRKEADIIMTSIFEDMRKYMNLPNKTFTVGTNEDKTRGFVVFFDIETDGKLHKVFHDNKGYYIKVYEEE